MIFTGAKQLSKIFLYQNCTTTTTKPEPLSELPGRLLKVYDLTCPCGPPTTEQSKKGTHITWLCDLESRVPPTCVPLDRKGLHMVSVVVPWIHHNRDGHHMYTCFMRRLAYLLPNICWEILFELSHILTMA